MHAECRLVAPRPSHVSRVWFFRWGFGVWLGRVLFSVGHDTRSSAVSADATEDG